MSPTAFHRGVRRRTVPPAWLGGLLGVLLMFMCALSCTHDVSLLESADAGGYERPTTPGDASANVDGGVSCPGGPIRLPDAVTGTCAATLASRGHRFALCSCQDWTVSSSVYTQAFSSNPAIVAGPIPAAVGVDGKITSTADLWVKGSVYTSGVGGISISGHLDVGKTLHSAGPVALVPPGTATVWGDAFVSGDVTGAAMIDGALHLPASAVMGLATTAASVTREAVTVAPPCDCTPPFDVAAVIAAKTASNDNTAIGLDPNLLVNVTTPAYVDIPCGSFALSSISARTPITLAVHGHSLIAVSGDVTLTAGLMVTVDPGADLDMLVGGSLSSTGGFPVGSMSAAGFRLWMAGPGPMTLNGSPVLGGIVAAPQSNVVADNGLEILGSILADSFALGGQLEMSFDQAVLSSGTLCGDPKLDPIP
jgi:hypothetical protein